MKHSIHFESTARLVTLFIVVVLLLSQDAHSAGRIIRIPLGRLNTQGIGSLGQPVINYYAPIYIGTPAKSFSVQFDVGLNDIFVPHYNWNPFKTNLHYSNGYQCKVSSTCVKNNRQYVADYMGCQMTGKPYEDVIHFGSAYAQSAPAANQTSSQPVALIPVNFRQNFLAVSDASDARFKDMPIDGFVGLGPQAVSPATTCKNLLVSLHDTNHIDNLQFSLWFNPVLDSNQGGELALGGADTNKYQGQIFWHRLSGVAGDRWALNLQQVVLGNAPIGCSPENCHATFSTMLNEVYGPRAEVQRIYNLLNTSRQESGIEQIDCRRLPNLPTLTFYMDGIPYALLPSNYIRKMDAGRGVSKKEVCYVAILPSESHTHEWILGINFLSAYYSIFDMTYKQIGFAALK